MDIVLWVIAVVALLIRVAVVIAADRRILDLANGGTAIPVRGVAVVAFLTAIKVSIAADLELTGRGAAVGGWTR